MKYFTLVVAVEDGHNTVALMKSIENLNGISFSAGSWTHALDDRDALRREIELIKT